jgi:hypothetical protein
MASTKQKAAARKNIKKAAAAAKKKKTIAHCRSQLARRWENKPPKWPSKGDENQSKFRGQGEIELARKSRGKNANFIALSPQPPATPPRPAG